MTITKQDVEWVKHSLSRHTKGPDVWWQESHLSFGEAVELIVSVWEAGRNKVKVNPRSPYECYWSRRALAAEEELERVKSDLSRACDFL